MMKTFLSPVVVCMALVLGLPMKADAGGDDLENCKFRGGEPMPLQSCASLRKRAAEDAERLKLQEAREKLRKEQLDQWQAEQAAKREAQQAEEDRRQAVWREEVQARQRQYDKERAEDERRAAQQEKAANALKQECGADYRNPSIGMTIERAKKCVGSVKLIGQVNRADGVVSTYASGRTYMHVMDGRIVSWGK